MKFGIILFIALAIIIMAILISCRNGNSIKATGPWYSFLTKDEKQQFETDVNSYFSQKDKNYVVNFNDGFVSKDTSQSYGLENIAQIYHQSSTEERKSLVADHFEKIFKAELEEAKLIENISDFNSMKKYLSIRIYPIDYANQIGRENLVGRIDIDSSITLLVLDLPSTVRSLKPEEVKKWNVSEDSLFSMGIKNAVAGCQVEISEQELTKTLKVWLVSSDNVFTSTHIFNLHAFPQCIGKFGALLLVPHRHSIILYPINDLGVIEATKILIPLGQRMFVEGPGSITPFLTWYHDNKFTNLSYQVENGNLNFIPPDEFVKTLNLLGEKK
jgi:hypothetical protein